MLAVDTNIVVRFLVNDDPLQVERVKRLIDENDLFVCTTVMLETEWVLRSVYGFAAPQVANALTRFAGLPHIRLEDPGRTARALGWAADGMDFADAMHLSSATACDALISFDRRLARTAARLGAIEVRLP